MCVTQSQLKLFIVLEKNTSFLIIKKATSRDVISQMKDKIPKLLRDDF